ncbi:MAG: hypothetical protein Q8N53_04780 [Longimicrobiales bacterium]|nr:hypothetical protein [Longimicrobiales bacterium]
MRTHSLLIVGVLAFVALGCQDLEITNPNNPDRTTVVSSSSDVEALVSTSFRRWFNLTQGLTPSTALCSAADEFSGGFTDYGTHEQGLEPRNAIDNGPISANSPNRGPFSTIYSIIGGVNIALQAIDKYDLKIMSSGADVTQRAWAFGKFTQGLTHGWQALLYDKGWAYSETMDTDTILFVEGSTQVQDLIRDYKEVRDTALGELAEALRIAESSQFTVPGSYQGDWVPGIEMSNQQFAKLIHSFMARYMVYWARTPEERAQVKWAEVISHIDKGITQDFAPMGTPDIMDSGYKNRAARQRTTTPGDFMRVDYQAIGAADQGSGYITWRAKPWSDRTPFIMTNVQDKRIMSSPGASCTSNTANSLAVEGKYMGCHLSTVFSASRGTGQRSYYYFHRLGRGVNYNTGPLLIMSVAEMDLLKAEGLIRLGRASEAVPLINKTRVANGGLPPVTLDGVPGPLCTPRKFNGDCGSLWDALRYEKRVEGLGTDAGVAHWDARGWGAFVINTPLHYPIPGNQLELMGIPEYTTGGGGYSSATAPNPEKCPVALPRCP